MKNDAETASTSLIDNERAKSAFTLTDLLVVMSVLALLMALFACSRVRAAAGSPASVCQDNLRRLSLAWYLYASDHGGRLVNNFDISDTLDTITGKTYLNWANNVMTWLTDPSVTNIQLTASSKLFPYLGNDPSVFRCPRDTYLSPAQVKAGWTQRARSYSMNGSMGSPFQHPWSNSSTVVGISAFCPERRQFLNLANILAPSGIFTFLEESPNSLNDECTCTVAPLTTSGTTYQALFIAGPATSRSQTDMWNFTPGCMALPRHPSRLMVGGGRSLSPAKRKTTSSGFWTELLFPSPSLRLAEQAPTRCKSLGRSCRPTMCCR